MKLEIQLLTQIQAARFLNRSLRTLGMWRERHYGPAYVRIGKAVMYQMEDLELFLARSRIKCDQEARNYCPEEDRGRCLKRH